MRKKKEEIVDQYQELKREMRTLRQCREVALIPLITGALRRISRNFRT